MSYNPDVLEAGTALPCNRDSLAFLRPFREEAQLFAAQHCAIATEGQDGDWSGDLGEGVRSYVIDPNSEQRGATAAAMSTIDFVGEIEALASEGADVGAPLSLAIGIGQFIQQFMREKELAKLRADAAKPSEELEQRALASLFLKPKLTESERADDLGCHRSTLYRIKPYRDAVKAMVEIGRQDIQRGTKYDGQVDSWQDKPGRD